MLISRERAGQMISSLFALNLSGEVIIEKQFREKIPRSSLEDFWSMYIAPIPVIEDAPSVIQYSRFAFIHILRNNVVLLGITTQEVPPMLVIEVLSMIGNTISAYLKELTEDSLRENFSVVYQLLEELIQNGYPLTTELHVLEELVPPPTLENKVRSILEGGKKKGRYLDGQMVPWRAQDLKYSTNEILFDFWENMDITIDAEGGLVRASVRGSCEVHCRLSGMPDVLLQLKNSEIFDDVSFHRCVRTHRYETDRSFSFVPPDGNFTLFEYRCKPLHSLQPPFYVNPQVTFSKEGGRINCMIGVRPQNALDKDKEIHKMVVHIPLPPQTDTVTIPSCSHGTHSFNSSSKVLTWKVGHLSMSSSPSLSGEFQFGNNNTEYLMEGTGENVTVEFQVPNLAISGVRVDSVSILNESYTPYKGVKYITKAGRFCIRSV